MDKHMEINTAGSLLPACVFCGCTLARDEIALTRKLINRGAREFLCLNCLSRKFDVPRKTLEQKIVEFREMGCTLFS